MVDEHYIWQPVVLILNKRLECRCGNRALFVVLEIEEHADEEDDWDYSPWCQDCWEREQGKVES